MNKRSLINARVTASTHKLTCAVALTVCLAALSSWVHAAGNDHLEVARGLGIEGAFQGSSYDSVNEFNGQVNVSIPLGTTFTTGSIEYNFHAVYNSRNWEWVVRHSPIDGYYDQSFESMTSNAGLGWHVSFGELYQPYLFRVDLADVVSGVNEFKPGDKPPYSWINSSTRDWVYMAPDGSRHVLSCDADYSGSCVDGIGAVYLSKGFQIRMQRETNTRILLNFANGITHTFEFIQWDGCWQGSHCWKLKKIEDLHKNSVLFGYTQNLITVSDNRTRIHKIHYKNSVGDSDLHNDGVIFGWGYQSYQKIVSKIELNTQLDLKQSYGFRYSAKVLTRERPHVSNVEPVGDTHKMPMLDGIDFPLLGGFEFAYQTDTDFGSGLLTSYTLPTGASVIFAYQDGETIGQTINAWQIPKGCNYDPESDSLGGIPHFDAIDRSLFPGIKTRTEINPHRPQGSTSAITTYVSEVARGNYINRNWRNQTCDRPDALVTTIDYPANGNGQSLRKQTWFSVEQDGPDNPWKPSEYGLPLDKEDVYDGHYRSSEWFLCTGSGSCPSSPYQTEYRKYATVIASDNLYCEAGDPVNCNRTDVQLTGRVIRNHAAATTVKTEYSDYDGVGHMRTEVSSSTGFESNPTRTNYINWNNNFSTSMMGDVIDVSQIYSVLPSLNENWLFTTYGITRTSGTDGGLSMETDHCWYRDRIGQSLIKNGSQGLLTGYGYHPDHLPNRGDLVNLSMKFAGGTTPTSCVDDPNTFYRQKFELDNLGNQTAIKYQNSNDFAGTEKGYNGRGYLTSEKTEDDILTSYTRDVLGRVTLISVSSPPGAGTLDNTIIAYHNALNTIQECKAHFIGRDTPACAIITRGDYKAVVFYDGFGRIFQEVTTMPGNEKRIVSVTMDGTGLTTQYNVNGALQSLEYDALGRLTKQTGVDNQTIAFSHNGDKSTTRTADLGNNVTQSLTTIRDGLGRDHRIKNGKYCTEYAYDPQDQLISATRKPNSCTGTLSQTRRWEYDARGFLQKMFLPELGDSGNSGDEIEYMTFNPYGQARDVEWPNRRLVHEYDVRGRLLSIQHNNQDILSHQYINGRLVKSTRHNRFGTGLNSNDYPVVLDHVYLGKGGRLSKTTTTVNYPSPADTTLTKTFDISYEYNAQGLLELLCMDGTCEMGNSANYTYTNELLTGVNWFSDTTPSGLHLSDIRYLTSGQVEQIDFPGINGVRSKFTYSHNDTRLQSILVQDTGGGEVWNSENYVYNALGQIHKIGDDVYQYDEAMRLTSSNVMNVAQTYTYNEFDNIVNFAGVDLHPTPQNRLNVGQIEYDRDGNVTEDGCFIYSYDALNMVQSMTGQGAPGSDCGYNVDHLYDANNLRVLSMCDGCSTPSDPPSFDFFADPTVIFVGQDVTLNWENLQNVDACEATSTQAIWSGPVSPSGGKVSFAPPFTDTYSLTCTGPGGELTRQVTVTVNDTPLSCDITPSGYLLGSGGEPFHIDAQCTDGLPPYQYQWQFSASGNPGSYQNLSNGGAISGAQSVQLNIAALTTGHAGFYRLNATDDLPTGTVISTVLELEVAGFPIIGEVGHVQLSSVLHNVVTLQFSTQYTDPVLFMLPVSGLSGDSLIPRVFDVRSDSADVLLWDFSGDDPVDHSETLNYLVMERGNWYIGGHFVKVDVLQTDATVGRLLPANIKRWEYIPFNVGFDVPPVVISQVQDANVGGELQFMSTRTRNITLSGFELAMEGAESNDYKFFNRKLGYIAIEPGNGVLFENTPFVAGRVNDAVTPNWYSIAFPSSMSGSPNARFIAALSSYNGADSAHLRYQGLNASGVQVRIEEDTTVDAETGHVPESVDYLAFSDETFIYDTLVSCSIPDIIEAPSGQMILTEGENALLEVEAIATGSSPLSYRWQKNGVDLAGQTGTQLALNNLQLSDSGDYNAVVEYGCGQSIDTSSVDLVVQPDCAPPTITQQLPPSIVAEHGEGVIMQMDVEPGNGESLTLQWQKDGVDIENAQGYAFVFQTIRPQDAGTYRVRIEYQCGEVYSNETVLTVTPDVTGPEVEGQTSSAQCIAQSGAECTVPNGNFTVTVPAASDPGVGVDTDAYRVCRSHSTPSGFAGCDVMMSSATTRNFTVTGAHRPPPGERRAYYFRAVDNAGNLSDWYDPLYITTESNDPPQPPGNLMASDGTFEYVELTWNNPANAQHYRVYRGTQANASDRALIAYSGSNPTNFTGGGYIDYTASPGQVYYYWASAENQYGIGGYSNSDAGHRADSPQPDLVMENAAVSDDTLYPNQYLNLTGQIRNLNQASIPPVSFWVRAYLSNNTQWDAGDHMLGLFLYGAPHTNPENYNENAWIPNGTAAGQKYVLIRVDDENDLNESNENNNIAVLPITILPATGPGQVPGLNATINGQNVSNLTVNSTNPTIQINWNHASHDSGIDKYHVVLQNTDGSSGWLFGANINYPGQSHTMHTSGLVYGQDYHVRVRALSNAGVWGPFTLTGTFKVREPKPTTVPNFVASINGVVLQDQTIYFNDPQIQMTWNHSTHPSGIDFYHIILEATDGSSGWLYGLNVQYPTTAHTLHTSDLVYGKDYRVRIRALSNSGVWGDFVSGGQFKVREPKPSLVPNFVAKVGGQNLNGMTLSNNSPLINFTWSHASDPIGIDFYHVIVQNPSGAWIYGPNVPYPGTSVNLQTSNLVNGVHTYRIRAKNTFGNWGDFIIGGTFTVDAP